MAQQGNMAAMGPTGGPVGGHAMMNNMNNVNNGASESSMSQVANLNTYIYDYFIKNGQYDLARAVHSQLPTNTLPNNSSDAQGGVNGVNDGMDEDSKDNINKIPDDLPRPRIISIRSDHSFLLDWWSQFWDVYAASKSKGKAPQSHQSYYQHTTVSLSPPCTIRSCTDSIGRTSLG
jgi:hypothetical protein